MYKVFQRILIVCAITILSGIGFYSYTQAQSIDDLQQQINDRAEERANLEKEAERIQQELSTTKGEKSLLTAELNRINGERKSLENTIKQTENQIDSLDLKITKSKQEISRYSSEIQSHAGTIAGLLRGISRQNNLSLLEVVAESSNLSDIFILRDSYTRLQKPLVDLTNTLESKKLDLRKTNELLALEQEELEEEKSILGDQKSIVQEKEQEKNKVLTQTTKKETSYQQSLNKTLAVIDALDKEIRDFESKLEFALNPNSIPQKGSAVLDWPLSKVLITQRFGKTVSSSRLYVSGSHSGMDFRAAVGTPVYAVADGVVKGVGDTDVICPSASFGKWVFIEHNIGLSTTIGHLSKWVVTEGQKVSKGDLIAYSGNTGHSTGPHLHLTVYATKGVNGEQGARVTDRPSSACAGKTYRMPLAPTTAYLDPLEYLPKTDLSYFKHPSLAN